MPVAEPMTYEEWLEYHLAISRNFWQRVADRGETATYITNDKGEQIVINRGHPQLGDVVQEMNARAYTYLNGLSRNNSLEWIINRTLEDFRSLVTQDGIIVERTTSRKIVIIGCSKENVQLGTAFPFVYEE